MPLKTQRSAGPLSWAIRTAPDGTEQSILRGLLLPYGGHNNGRDSYGEYFDAQTDFVLSWGKAAGGWPLLYHHGLSEDAGLSPIGRIESIAFTDAGGEMEATLDQESPYYGEIKAKVTDGDMFLSSGAMAHLVQTTKETGHIKRWPVVEGSCTPAPANLFATVDFVTAKAHLKAAGLDIPPELEAAAPEIVAADDTTDTLPIAAKAAKVISLDGSYEDLQADLADALNPKPAYGYADCHTAVLATFPDAVIVCTYNYEAEDDDERQTYWRIPYTIGEDGDPVLGTPTALDQVYIPTAKAAVGNLARDALSLSRQAAALRQRSEDLAQRRAADGRPLSAHNQKALTDLVSALDSARDGLDALRTAPAPTPAQSTAEAAPPGPSAERLRDLEILKLVAATL